MKDVKHSSERVLQSARANFEYLEYCRVHMDGERLVYAVAEDAATKQWNIPTVNTSALLLGPGTSITQAALQKLSSERVLVGFTAGGGVPIYLGSFSEYAPTEYLLDWISGWGSEKWRLGMAKQFAFARCDFMDKAWQTYDFLLEPTLHTKQFRNGITRAASVEELRGVEGAFAKKCYVAVAKAVGIKWNGRIHQGDDQDLANSYLDHGNYLAYGLAAVVLWALGIPPGLAVNHGATRAGGLVFDLADIIKDSVILPCAFACAKSGVGRQRFREIVIDKFDELDALPNLFTKFKNSVHDLKTPL
jgi:CRISPR-associated protein Cas1